MLLQYQDRVIELASTMQQEGTVPNRGDSGYVKFMLVLQLIAYLSPNRTLQLTTQTSLRESLQLHYDAYESW